MTSHPELPRVSIIIPTHNRSVVLSKTLQSLRTQIYPASNIEVIVAADFCTDDTRAVVENFQAGFPILYTESIERGPAAARNAGAQASSGNLLIFLDDDVAASPQLVQSHVQAHEKTGNYVAIGYLEPILTTQTGLFLHELRSWWGTFFSELQEPGHRFCYTDLIGANISLSAEIFKQLGGFNQSFFTHEDYELGYRLIQSGIQYKFVREAVGYHHDNTNLQKSIDRKFQEGKYDVALAKLYPELIPALPMTRLFQQTNILSKVLRNLAFLHPNVEKLFTGIAQIILRITSTMKLRFFWRWFLYSLYIYTYWLGIHDEVNSLNELQFMIVENPPTYSQKPTILDLDLLVGIREAEKIVDKVRPDSVILNWDKTELGVFPAQPGKEKLRGVHLESILLSQRLIPYLQKCVEQERIRPFWLTESIQELAEKDILYSQ